MKRIVISFVAIFIAVAAGYHAGAHDTLNEIHHHCIEDNEKGTYFMIEHYGKDCTKPYWIDVNSLL